MMEATDEKMARRMGTIFRIDDLDGVRQASDWSFELGAPNGAWLSSPAGYRLLLWRTFEARRQAPPMVFGMQNPSGADGHRNDPTIRRCIGFAEREQAGGILVVNLSPWVATDPKELVRAHRDGEDVLFAEENRRVIEMAFGRATIVLAWGASAPKFLDGAARHMREASKGRARCLGKTRSGEPRHPLYLRNDSPLVAFP